MIEAILNSKTADSMEKPPSTIEQITSLLRKAGREESQPIAYNGSARWFKRALEASARKGREFSLTDLAQMPDEELKQFEGISDGRIKHLRKAMERIHDNASLQHFER